ncbi:hypothetical protein SDC9_89823 [bioreactor metagenome]|uniref:Uncharacterized protein n=1 Tax=bioreactor metagenome TaxID=1076179 RepID=A0A644ZQA2_9ZZZZ
MGPRADRREVRARVGLAHADAERTLALGDARHDLGRQRVGRIAHEQRPHLPIGRPVPAHGRSYGQHFLEHHIAFEGAALAAAVARGPGHAQPAMLCHATGGGLVAAGPTIGPRFLVVGGDVRCGKGSHLLTQRLALCGQVAQFDVNSIHGFL